MTASAWTDDRVGRLKTLWLEGRSAAQIARDLDHGLTRSAVLGKVYRLGLSAARARPRASVLPRPSPPKRRRSQSTGALQAIAEPALVPEQGEANLLSVRRGQCRWPYGDPNAQDFSFCGRPVARGAFCGPHAAIAYRPQRQTPESREKLARLG